MTRLAFLFLFSAIYYVEALAGSLADARTLFIIGEYDAAIQMAIAEDTPEGLTLAAEILSAKVMLGYVEDHNKSAKQAKKWAEKAMKTDPNSQEARVQFALAYGFETRTSSPFTAWRKSLPKKTMAAIDVVRTYFPDDPRGDALLGAWHLGIVRKAGSKRAKSMFDAEVKLGIDGYEAALAAAPDDVVIGSNYAVTILAIDTEKYFDRGVEILRHIVSLPPQNAVDRDIQARMQALLSFSEDRDLLTHAVKVLINKGAPPMPTDEVKK